jgi:hypothetical protein
MTGKIERRTLMEIWKHEVHGFHEQSSGSYNVNILVSDDTRNLDFIHRLLEKEFRYSSDFHQ